MTRGDVAALVTAAVDARPTLDRVAFAEHLAEIAPLEGDLAVADLALAFQAAHGDPVAVAELHAALQRSARAVLVIAGYTSAVADDAIQETLVGMLVGPRGKAGPLLFTYQGRARLSVWAKTILLRTASRLNRIEKGAIHDDDDEILGKLAGSDDPFTAVVKAELRPAVRAAFAAAVRRLSYFHRELLGGVILHGETIDKLSRRHDVHRSTAARWVGRARAALDENLRREVGASLLLTPSEVSSVLKAVASSIELTLDRLVHGMPSAHE